MRFRRTLAGLAVAGLVTGGLLILSDRSGEGEDRVTRAQVPGIGDIAGAVRPDTRVRPPARIPRPGRRGDAISRRMSVAQNRAYREANPGENSGSGAEREAVRAALADKLFLWAAAYACVRPPPAALAVLDYVFVAPQRRPELHNLIAASGKQGRQQCPPIRLRIDAWDGVSVRGDAATAVLRGAKETRVDARWEPRRHEWRAVLQRTGGDWKIAALAGEDLDYRD